jgi:mannose-6-phosphate isomerase-like protein (cupin superfamily)
MSSKNRKLIRFHYTTKVNDITIITLVDEKTSKSYKVFGTEETGTEALTNHSLVFNDVHISFEGTHTKQGTYSFYNGQGQAYCHYKNEKQQITLSWDLASLIYPSSPHWIEKSESVTPSSPGHEKFTTTCSGTLKECEFASQ